MSESESKPSRSPSHLLLGLVGLGFVIITAGIIYSTSSPSSQITLNFDPSLIPYKFPVDSSKSAELNFLENRVKNAPSPQDQLSLAQLYLGQQRRTGDETWYDKAKGVLNELKMSSTEDHRVLLLEAQLLQMNHKFKESLKIVNRVLKGKPNYRPAQVLKAQIKMAIGQPQNAILITRKLVQQVPLSQAFTLHALALERNGQIEEANKQYIQSLKMEDVGQPLSASKRRAQMGRMYLRFGKVEIAELLLLEAFRIDNQNALAAMVLGDLYLVKDQGEKAEQFYLSALGIDKNLQTASKLYRFYKDRGEVEKIQAMEALLEAKVNSKEEIELGHGLDLVRFLLFRGTPEDLKKASKIIRNEQKTRPDATVLFFKARIALKRGQMTHLTQVSYLAKQRTRPDLAAFMLEYLPQSNREDLVDEWKERVEMWNPHYVKWQAKVDLW